MQGFSMAPLQALTPAVISDVFFLEERGFQLSLYNLGFIGGINLQAPISGAIQQAAGIANVFYGIGGAFILMLILQFFLLVIVQHYALHTDEIRPETAYHRPHRLDLDIAHVRNQPFWKTL